MSTIPLLVVACVLALGGCNKPSEESCKLALTNMRTLIGTDSATATTDLAGDVRRCRGGSSRKAVECAAAATTIDQLKACDFMKVADKKAAAAGSATTPAGSAAVPAPVPAPTTEPATGTGSAAAPAGSDAPAGSTAPGVAPVDPAAGSNG
ncbi:MAG: hypothetical protein M3680_19635 [Myxococcota bacterium]|nr:hypothetical protein [Myxococcota bacterium]